MEQMKQFYIFTLHPTYKLDEIVSTESLRDERIESWKETYPNVPIFWIVVNEG